MAVLSTEPKQQLLAALLVFLWPVVIKIHPTEIAVALLLAVVADLVVQTLYIILSIKLLHAVLHRNHLCIPRTLLVWKASSSGDILVQEVNLSLTPFKKRGRSWLRWSIIDIGKCMGGR